MDWLQRNAQKRIFFTPFSPFLAHFLFFSCKTAYAIFKVLYQTSHIPKIRKIYGLVAKQWSKMHIFHTFFAIIGQQIVFFSKIRLRSPLNTIKSYLYTKNQKKTMGPFERNLSGRTYGRRTDGRMYECKSIVPPKFLGRSKNSHIFGWNQGISCIY